MAKFELSHAVHLFSENSAAINNLWAIYVVATFAAAGYGASSTSIPTMTTIAVTVGFWAFALGHLSLLTQALKTNVLLEQDITLALKESPSAAQDVEHFKPTIQYLVSTANPLWISVSTHLLIDLCVTLALWSGALVGA